MFDYNDYCDALLVCLDSFMSNQFIVHRFISFLECRLVAKMCCNQLLKFRLYEDTLNSNVFIYHTV